MVTELKVTRAYFDKDHPRIDILVFNLNPVAGGRMNWSDLLVASPVGEVHTYSIPFIFFLSIVLGSLFDIFII